MLTDLLIKGAIRLGICHVAAIGASKVIEAVRRRAERAP